MTVDSHDSFFFFSHFTPFSFDAASHHLYILIICTRWVLTMHHHLCDTFPFSHRSHPSSHFSHPTQPFDGGYYAVLCLRPGSTGSVSKSGLEPMHQPSLQSTLSIFHQSIIIPLFSSNSTLLTRGYYAVLCLRPGSTVLYSKSGLV